MCWLAGSCSFTTTTSSVLPCCLLSPSHVSTLSPLSQTWCHPQAILTTPDIGEFHAFISAAIFNVFSHGTSKFCPLWPTVLFTFVSEILSSNSKVKIWTLWRYGLLTLLTAWHRLRAASECEPVMTSSSCCDDVTLVCSLQKYRHHHSTPVLCPGRKSFINLKYSCIQCTGRSVTEMDVLYIQNFLDFFQPTVRLSRYFGGLVVSRGAWVRGL